jgi:putative Ca2+/H+ antiporter (TMEM165/GDT1 family)
MLVCLVLGAHYRALLVWLGAAGAFALHVGLAVAAGGLLSLLPDRLMLVLFVALLLVGTVVLLRVDDAEELAVGTEQGVQLLESPRSRSATGVVGLSFGAVFVGEWGDITQIATMNLAAQAEQPVAVGAGAYLALCTVVGLAVTAGSRLRDRLPVRAVRRVAAGVLAVLAVAAVLQAA